MQTGSSIMRQGVGSKQVSRMHASFSILHNLSLLLFHCPFSLVVSNLLGPVQHLFSQCLGTSWCKDAGLSGTIDILIYLMPRLRFYPSI